MQLVCGVEGLDRLRQRLQDSTNPGPGIRETLSLNRAETVMALQRFDEAAVNELRTRVRGEIIRPTDPGYDEARKVYNAMHDRRPALIVRAAGVADVIATVTFARAHDAVLAVRGGGHSVPGFGTCD
jgi:hypothetical protein